MALEVVALVSLAASLVGAVMNFARTPPEDALNNLSKWGRLLSPWERLWRYAFVFATSGIGRGLTGVLFTSGMALLILPSLLVEPISQKTGGDVTVDIHDKNGKIWIPDRTELERFDGLSDYELQHLVYFKVHELWDVAREYERRRALIERYGKDPKSLVPKKEALELIDREERDLFYKSYWSGVRPIAIAVGKRLGKKGLYVQRVRFMETLVEIDNRPPTDGLFSKVGNWLFYANQQI